MDKLPLLSVDLIELFDRPYADKCPRIDASDRQIWFDAGVQSVLNMLVALLKDYDTRRTR